MAVKIYKRLSSGTDADYTVHSTAANSASPVIASGLTAETAYTFRFDLLNDSGVVVDSEVVTATTEAAAGGGGEIPGETPGSTAADILTDYHTLAARAAPELSLFTTFANALETGGVFDEMVGGYTLEGGSETANKFNMFHPSAVEGALTAIFGGTVTHQTDGVLFAANSGYMDTGILYRRIPNAPNIGITWFTKDLLTGSIIGDGADITLYPFDTDTKAYNFIAVDTTGTGATVTGGNTAGFKTVQRVGDIVEMYHGTTKVAEKTDPVTHELGLYNTIKLHWGYPNDPHNQNASFTMFFIHQPFNATKQAVLINAATALLDGLGIDTTP